MLAWFCHICSPFEKFFCFKKKNNNNNNTITDQKKTRKEEKSVPFLCFLFSLRQCWRWEFSFFFFFKEKRWNLDKKMEREREGCSLLSVENFLIWRKERDTFSFSCYPFFLFAFSTAHLGILYPNSDFAFLLSADSAY